MIIKYIDIYIIYFIKTLKLNVLNPGDGLLFLNTIRELQKMDDFKKLRYDITFYGSLGYELMGNAFDNLMNDSSSTETRPEIDEELLGIARANAYQGENRRGADRLAEMTQRANRLMAEKARLQTEEVSNEKLDTPSVFKTLVIPEGELLPDPDIPSTIETIAKTSVPTSAILTSPIYSPQSGNSIAKQPRFKNLPTGVKGITS